MYTRGPDPNKKGMTKLHKTRLLAALALVSMAEAEHHDHLEDAKTANDAVFHFFFSLAICGMVRHALSRRNTTSTGISTAPQQHQH